MFLNITCHVKSICIWWHTFHIVSSVALVLAGHVSEAHISWLGCTYRNTTPLSASIYKAHSVLSAALPSAICSEANCLPPSPAPPLIQSGLGLLAHFSWIILYIKLLNINDICNTFVGSVLSTLRGFIAALPVLINARRHGWALSSCPEQNQTANPNYMLLVNHLWR